MSYIKKLLNLKNVSDLKFEGSVRLEGFRRLIVTLKLKWSGNRRLFAGIKYSKGFRNLGEVRCGENRFELEDCEGEDFSVLVGDSCGPVACCSTCGEMASLYGYCDRLGDRHDGEEKNETADDPAEPPEPPPEEVKFDLKEMGVTDVLLYEDSTLGDDLEPYADVKEDYYEKERLSLRERNMKEFFSKIQSLLENNEREPRLEALFPASRFVRIDFDGSGKYYVVGAVYEEERLRYLCYGVPMHSPDLPEKFVGIAQYVDCGETGFLLLYQDAETGAMLTAANFV